MVNEEFQHRTTAAFCRPLGKEGKEQDVIFEAGTIKEFKGGWAIDSGKGIWAVDIS